MSTFTAKLRSDKRKNPEMKVYRHLTIAECKALHGYAMAVDRHGDIARVQITSIKTWKTRPEFEVRWKFGMYEFGRELITRDEDNRFFVIEVTDEVQPNHELYALALERIHNTD
jgi:hypothetical protein